MSWEKVSEGHKGKYNRNYVACHEPAEREFVRVLITIHFPSLRKSRIVKAIDEACKKMESPRHIDEFLECVEDILSKEAHPVSTRQPIKI